MADSILRDTAKEFAKKIVFLCRDNDYRMSRN